MLNSEGKPLRLDPNARSASTDLPAFLTRPSDAPVYHGFTIIEETRKDDWVFGSISDYQDPGGCEWGDAFVIAPDGSRAGIVWVTGEVEVHEICPPSPERWGVYGFGFPKLIRNTTDFVECCHQILPKLKRIHAALTNGNK